MTTMTSNNTKHFAPDLLGAAVIALATLAAGWFWLAHDTTYQIDPATGDQSGPYEAWQVVGAVLTLVIIAAVGGALIRPWVVTATMAVTATGLFAAVAAPTDETGLWGVGALMTLWGVTAAAGAVSFGAWFLRRTLRR